MLQPNTVASPATFTMLAMCALGIGFMIRFLIALASEENKIRVVHPVRRGEQITQTRQMQPVNHPGIDGLRLIPELTLRLESSELRRLVPRIPAA